MNNRQFSFSFSVGVALVALGLFILGTAAVGFSLITIGVIIAALAMFTRFATAKASRPLSTAASVGRFDGSAAEY